MSHAGTPLLVPSPAMLHFVTIMCAVVTVVIIGLAHPMVRADTITIDFESFPGPDGRLGTPDDVPTPACPTGGFCGPLSSEYASAGITFTSGTLFQGNFFPGTEATNHFISSSQTIATFTLPVYEISLTSYSFWTAILWAFDSAGQVLATAVLVNPAAGSQPLLGTLHVVTQQPIASVKVLAENCSPLAEHCDQILNVDDLIVATAAACDANADGTIDRQDALAVLRFLLRGLPLAGNGDCNGDGRVDFHDVLAILWASQ
jgi:hypothetical protein